MYKQKQIKNSLKLAKLFRFKEGAISSKDE